MKISKLCYFFIFMAGFMGSSMNGETVYCISQDTANQLQAAHKRGDTTTVNTLRNSGCNKPEYSDMCQGRCHMEFDHDGYPEYVCPCYPVDL